MEGAALDLDWRGWAVGGEEDSGGRGLEVADEVDGVGGETQEFEDEGEQVVVLGGEGAFEVNVVDVCVSVVGMGVF